MITVFGSINVDLVLQVAAHPRPGETITGATRNWVPGGKGANQALAAARAGAAVRMVGAVGNDNLADIALSELKAGGVDVGAVARLDNAQTGLAAVVVDADGENTIVVAPGANRAATAGQVDALDFRPEDTLMLQLEARYAEGRLLAERAATQGARVILTVAPFRPLSADDVAPVSMLVMNQHEAADFAGYLGVAGADAPDCARRVAEALGKTVIVTLGADGAVAADGNRLVRVPALAVTPVDTTGAGDAFTGMLAAGLDRGDSLEAAMTAAAVAGSLASTKEGAQPSFPTRTEIDAALAAREIA